ncbi:formylglycine-generating enzyme family protein [Catenuloplanes sp. NPDC051500]|uniref:formylglycine-generating enzyme family protein n=1 Tax=Catenuloplanes sp. NPDC051500 TaxID=3363959 RepID=UPI0037BE148D
MLPDGIERDTLTGIVDDPDRPLDERLAAGAILGLVGDPRVPPIPGVVEIPGGEFEMGTGDARLDRALHDWAHLGLQRSWLAKETPAHRVRVGDFRLGRYPVTNGQYYAFLTATGHEPRPSTWYLGAYPWDRSNHPVAGIGAADADAYTAWLAATTGRAFRLPTEAEWEYAARGGDDREYPWGERFDAAHANVHETGVGTTTPVGAFPAGRSVHGVDDLAGNIEEYVSDEYAPYPGGPAPDQRDDLVRTLGTYRITRGGSFARSGDLARTRRRHGPYPGPEYPPGLRVACS